MFSVIIPVHNSEKTIEVLKKFEGNEIIKIIHQSNMGVSSARNTGLNHVSAQSKFVTFVDDSDFLSKDFF